MQVKSGMHEAVTSMKLNVGDDERVSLPLLKECHRRCHDYLLLDPETSTGAHKALSVTNHSDALEVSNIGTYEVLVAITPCRAAR